MKITIDNILESVSSDSPPRVTIEGIEPGEGFRLLAGLLGPEAPKAPTPVDLPLDVLSLAVQTAVARATEDGRRLFTLNDFSHALMQRLAVKERLPLAIARALLERVAYAHCVGHNSYDYRYPR